MCFHLSILHPEQSTFEFDMDDAGAKLEAYAVVKEGEAEILLPSGDSGFYNDAQVPNSHPSSLFPVFFGGFLAVP